MTLSGQFSPPPRQTVVYGKPIATALPAELYRREPLPREAAFLAGKAFLQYRKRGGARSLPLPDFYIGAHAAIREYRLLTRDASRYRSYFPTVELVTPT